MLARQRAAAKKAKPKQAAAKNDVASSNQKSSVKMAKSENRGAVSKMTAKM